MLKFLVLSDIHMPDQLNRFPFEAIQEYINDIDLIFGLGDYTSSIGLDNLYAFKKEVYAVCGNMDDSSLKSQLPTKLKLTLENINIGLIHGWGTHYGLREKIVKEFEKVNLICYGHTHASYYDQFNEITFFNPGSICGQNPSLGILKLDNQKIEAEIIPIIYK